MSGDTANPEQNTGNTNINEAVESTNNIVANGVEQKKTSSSKSKKKTIILASICGFIVVAIIVIVIVVKQFAGVAKPSDFVGLTINEATALAEKVGLESDAWGYTYDPNARDEQKVSFVSAVYFADGSQDYSYDKYMSTDMPLKKGYKISFETQDKTKAQQEAIDECDELGDSYTYKIDNGKVVCYEKETNKTATPTTPSNNASTVESSTSSNTTWREVLTEYEAWMNKYIDFMIKYKNTTDNSARASMLSEYSALVSEMSEWTQKLDNIKGDLSTSDLNEYIQTLTRINQRLSEIQ